MFGKVKIGNKEYEMVSNAATAYWFRHIFKRDLLKFFAEAANGKEVDSEYLQMLAFIMNKRAEGADMMKLNEGNYVDWLEGLSQFDLSACLMDVLDVYQRGEKTESTGKNGDTQQRES